MKHIVTSKDGVQFITESDERTVPFDRALASTSLAVDLEAQGDFTRLQDLGEITLEETYFSPQTPEERRAAFYVIKGGKP